MYFSIVIFLSFKIFLLMLSYGMLGIFKLFLVGYFLMNILVNYLNKFLMFFLIMRVFVLNLEFLFSGFMLMNLVCFSFMFFLFLFYIFKIYFYMYLLGFCLNELVNLLSFLVV